MGKYRLSFHPAAEKELKKFDRQTKIYIIKSLSQFIESYSFEYERELIKTKKVKKLKGEYSGFYRLKLRTYRVIYEKIEDELIIHILRIAHRKEVY
jgi:mRNA interferase RelE/StbE